MRIYISDSLDSVKEQFQIELPMTYSSGAEQVFIRAVPHPSVRGALEALSASGWTAFMFMFKKTQGFPKNCFEFEAFSGTFHPLPKAEITSLFQAAEQIDFYWPGASLFSFHTASLKALSEEEIDIAKIIDDRFFSQLFNLKGSKLSYTKLQKAVILSGSHKNAVTFAGKLYLKNPTFCLDAQDNGCVYMQLTPSPQMEALCNIIEAAEAQGVEDLVKTCLTKDALKLVNVKIEAFDSTLELQPIEKIVEVLRKATEIHVEYQGLVCSTLELKREWAALNDIDYFDVVSEAVNNCFLEQL